MPRNELPAFKYHPDPIATGAIGRSASPCECCGRQRGLVYRGNVCSTRDVGAVCPWCIADGSVAAKFDATLNDEHPLVCAGVAAAIVEEVACRTPGYVSWQQASWIVCCDDACEFHGDAPVVEIRALDEAGLSKLSRDSGFSIEFLPEIVEAYEPGGSPAFYKFICRHCGSVRYRGDRD